MTKNSFVAEETFKYHIRRLYLMALSKSKEGFEPPKLFRVSSYYPWNVLISSNTNVFAKLLPNHTDFFRVHINQYWCFQRVIIKLYILFRIYMHQYRYFGELLSYIFFIVLINHFWQIKHSKNFQSSYQIILAFLRVHIK